jgi:hypothetical protein
MRAFHTLGSRSRDVLGTKRSPGRLWLWTAISFVALSAPAWADEQPRVTPISLVAPVASPAMGTMSVSVAALFGDHDAVGQKELAAQRGGAAFTVPVAQAGAPTAIPQIILWDELKSQAPAAPAGQGTNRINIQVR